MVGTQKLHPPLSGLGLASESLTWKQGHTGGRVCVRTCMHIIRDTHTRAHGCVWRQDTRTDDCGAGSPEASAGGWELQWVRVWPLPEGGARVSLKPSGVPCSADSPGIVPLRTQLGGPADERRL